jgi:hypothetical protein
MTVGEERGASDRIRFGQQALRLGGARRNRRWFLRQRGHGLEAHQRECATKKAFHDQQPCRLWANNP